MSRSSTISSRDVPTLLAISADRRALLHIENRTRFPNRQEAFGSFNAKRAHLALSVAQRLALSRGFEAVTHAVVALWSSEVLHVLRLRTASFEAVCPDPPDALLGWFAGHPPESGVTGALLVLDPIERPRARRWLGLSESLRAEPRHRGYAEAVDVMRASGRM